MNKKGGIEILLLLACMVATITFLCFSLGLLSIARDDNHDSIHEWEKEIHYWKEKESEPRKELDDLKKERDDLIKQKEQKEDILKKIGYPSGEKTALELDAAGLRKKIQEKRKRMEVLREKIAQFEEDSNIYNPWKELMGTYKPKNPIFVECKKDVLIIYPSKKVLTISEIEERNPFLKMSYGHDLIYLMVRPSGFQIFGKVKKKIQETGLRISYDPVEADKLIKIPGEKNGG